ncbi:Protein kish-A [Lamellibrachia satsuma]|nr:Protein kish-A [Lamellibrachia satsuma]
MLRSVLSVPQDVMDQLEYSGKPTAHDLKIINQPCEILQLFEEATNTKGELIVTSSMALGALAPRMLDKNKEGLLGIFWKCARIGERKSPYVAMSCIAMAVSILFWS